MNRSSIRHSIIFYFCAMVILVASVFAFLSFAFLFSVEDEFIERELEAEREYLIATYDPVTGWQPSRQPHIERYTEVSTLPDDLRPQMFEGNKRREFYGTDGRHYHVMRLPDDSLLVAEVSTRLVIRQLSESIFKIYGVLLAVLLCISFIIAYLLAGRALAPLTRLAALVESVQPDHLPRDFAADYPKNEVGTLAKALQTAMDRTRLFIKREQDFSRDVSHDLRTPIAVVRGSVELLEDQPELSGTMKGPLDRISVANEHMSGTVEALLSLAREEQSQKDQVLILPVIEKVILQLGHQLDNNRTEVELNVPDAASVYLQPGVLDILLANLLGNAVTYTIDGCIYVTFNEHRLMITDTGEGVSPEVQETMMQPGARGDRSSGFGLGLSIVARLCEHNQIDIKIEHLDNGTRVTLDFGNLQLS